jgi:cytoskeletal protein CcmA (bactofilin family)
MWTTKELPSSVPPATPTLPDKFGEGVRTPSPAPVKSPQNPHPADSAARVPSWLGPALKIKGQISGHEDLHVECVIEGPISVAGHRLTVGQNAHVKSEIIALEIVVSGEASGNLTAKDRVEIKRVGSVTGNVTTSRIMIEDGAYFKGSVEIVRKPQPDLNLDSLLARPEKKTL